MTTPLFIALKTEYYNAFDDGTKPYELRLYGPRWNERTCPPGRRVVLSKGYGKRNRLHGTITAFEKRSSLSFTGPSAKAISTLYGLEDRPIAVVHIKLDKHLP